MWHDQTNVAERAAQQSSVLSGSIPHNVTVVPTFLKSAVTLARRPSPYLNDSCFNTALGRAKSDSSVVGYHATLLHTLSVLPPPPSHVLTTPITLFPVIRTTSLCQLSNRLKCLPSVFPPSGPPAAPPTASISVIP